MTDPDDPTSLARRIAEADGAPVPLPEPEGINPLFGNLGGLLPKPNAGHRLITWLRGRDYNKPPA